MYIWSGPGSLKWTDVWFFFLSLVQSLSTPTNGTTPLRFTQERWASQSGLSTVMTSRGLHGNNTMRPSIDEHSQQCIHKKQSILIKLYFYCMILPPLKLFLCCLLWQVLILFHCDHVSAYLHQVHPLLFFFSPHITHDTSSVWQWALPFWRVKRNPLTSANWKLSWVNDQISSWEELVRSNEIFFQTSLFRC